MKTIVKNQQLFILFLLFFVAICLNSCKKSDDDKIFIKEIEMKEMSKLNLSDFNLIRESTDNLGTEYVYKRDRDSATVFIRLGISSSINEAERAIDKYLNSISIRMNNGPYQNSSFGDKFWWLAPDSTYTVTNIVFIRGNVFFIMSSHNYQGIIDLAKKLDEDILKKEPYIKFRI